MAAYHSYQVDMAVLYGADRARAEKEMRDVLNLEFALANVRICILDLLFKIKNRSDNVNGDFM